MVDYAKLLSATKEKERGEMVAKQTIRIKAPVTSEVLQDHISHLKTVAGDNKKQVRSMKVDFFIFDKNFSKALWQGIFCTC